MPSEFSYADVILPFALPQFFTYAVPDELKENVEAGKRVVVQFGQRKYYTAIIARLHKKAPEGIEIKEILSILDEKPLVSGIQLQFWKWVSEYYMCSLGEVMKAALPAGLKLESETNIYYNHSDENEDGLADTEFLVLETIRSQNLISIKDLSRKLNKKNILSVIKSLYDKGAIVLEESLKAGYAPKKEIYVQLTIPAQDEIFLNNCLDNLKKAKKQFELLSAYIRLSGIFGEDPVALVKKKVLLESAGQSVAAFNKLVEKGIFEIYKQDVTRLGDLKTTPSEMPVLSGVQNEALQKINEGFKNKDVALLHGVTSSGKTEIYFHLIKKMIDEGRQVLYLLPEIAITAQIINRLRTYFGNKVGIYHSKFSDNERVEIFNKLNSSGEGAYQIILGVRSSVFLPFNNLGLVIVDEEHENTFKQFDPAPRYNARDSAIVLAKLHNAKVVLGSATPSIESYYNSTSGKYFLVELKERYRNIKLPELRLVNLRIARKKGHMNSHFSIELLDEIEKCLKQSKQVILFQNRRGFSPIIECMDCGWVPRCKHCDVSLTYHKFQNQLVCHYCDYSTGIIRKCSECGQTNLQTVGFGTEKIEEELALRFPATRIGRMDLDSTRTKHAHENIISDFENQHINILIGTQMVTKGLDFENVGLVGILNADQMLNFPDFRAFERSFQLIVQVSGRAGRKNEQGLVIIQTSSPAHPIIRHVLKNDYQSMFNEQIEERNLFGYPPQFRLIRFTIKHKDEPICINAANNLANILKSLLGKRVVGPDKPIIGRIQNMYLRNILLKIEREAPISKLKFQLSTAVLNLNDSFKSLQVSIDVDPV
jgi:primosomal protein N' (replication factor Y)